MEKERLKFCIDRFDHYYDSINNKSAVFLGLGTFIVGGVIAAYGPLHDIADCGFWANLILFLIIALGLGNLILVISASNPYLSNDTDSIHYFGAIHLKGEQQFITDSTACCSPDQDLPDLRKQVCQLATGLHKKFETLRVAGFLFMIKFVMSIILLLIVAFNIK